MTAAARNFSRALGLPAVPLQQHPNAFAKLGAILILLEMVVLIGRTPELFEQKLGNSFFHQLILFTACLALVPLSGALPRLTKDNLFWILIALHGCYMLSVPFSLWRGGSVMFFSKLIRVAPLVLFLPSFARELQQLRRAFYAVGIGLVISLIWIVVSGTEAAGDRIGLQSGRFGNSNDIAMFLLCFLPFWLFIITDKKRSFFLRAACIALTVLAIWFTLKTGSRGGLLTIVMFFTILFFSFSMSNKLKYGIPSIILIAAFFAAMPSSIRDRLLSFSSNERSLDEALDSKEHRSALFLESVDIAIRHPIVGVGLGVYVEAAAKIAEDEGNRPKWQTTHNAYTLVAAENGFPAFFLYLASLIISVRRLNAIRKVARTNPETRDLFVMASCLLLSLLVFLLDCVFASTTYDLIYYVILSFVMAISAVASKEFSLRHAALAQAANVPLPVSAAEAGSFPSATPAFPPQSFGTPQTSTARGDTSTDSQPTAKPAAGPQYGEAPWKLNPRRYPPKPAHGK